MGYIYRKHMPFISTWNMVIQQWIYEMFNSVPLIFRQHPPLIFTEIIGLNLRHLPNQIHGMDGMVPEFFLDTSQTLSLIILGKL